MASYKAAGKLASMSIGKNLRELRVAAGLSQGALARAANVSQQLISQIENDVNGSTKELPKLALALGVTVDKIDPDFRAVVDDEMAELQSLFSRLSPKARKAHLDRLRRDAAKPQS